ncbi:hypothetical protein ACD578_28095 (plasmid) [Microvirga sp. RSM25]|uniref:hypothetical protein n=1 Tax=Microvirga sp. RSM25 TaxID=3273802 RepID=UPI00384B726F
MSIGVPKDAFEGGARIAKAPNFAPHLPLNKIGHECSVESGADLVTDSSDAAYRAIDVTLLDTSAELIQEIHGVVKERPPSTSEARNLNAGRTLIFFFYPAQHFELLDQCWEKGTIPPRGKRAGFIHRHQTQSVRLSGSRT